MMEDGLKDTRKRPIFIHSRLDSLPLTMEAFRVYCHLARRANDCNQAWPSYRTIGEICFRGSYPDSCSDSLRRKAIAAVKELITWNLVSVKPREGSDGRNTSNLYCLTDDTEWEQSVKAIPELARKSREYQPRHKAGGDGGSLGGGDGGSLGGGDGGSPGVVMGVHQGGDGGSPKGIPIEINPSEVSPLSPPTPSQEGKPEERERKQPNPKPPEPETTSTPLPSLPIPTNQPTTPTTPSEDHTNRESLNNHQTIKVETDESQNLDLDITGADPTVCPGGDAIALDHIRHFVPDAGLQLRDIGGGSDRPTTEREVTDEPTRSVDSDNLGFQLMCQLADADGAGDGTGTSGGRNGTPSSTLHPHLNSAICPHPNSAHVDSVHDRDAMRGTSVDSNTAGNGVVGLGEDSKIELGVRCEEQNVVLDKAGGSNTRDADTSTSVFSGETRGGDANVANVCSGLGGGVDRRVGDQGVRGGRSTHRRRHRTNTQREISNEPTNNLDSNNLVCQLTDADTTGASGWQSVTPSTAICSTPSCVHVDRVCGGAANRNTSVDSSAAKNPVGGLGEDFKKNLVSDGLDLRLDKSSAAKVDIAASSSVVQHPVNSMHAHYVGRGHAGRNGSRTDCERAIANENQQNLDSDDFGLLSDNVDNSGSCLNPQRAIQQTAVNSVFGLDVRRRNGGGDIHRENCEREIENESSKNLGAVNLHLESGDSGTATVRPNLNQSKFQQPALDTVCRTSVHLRGADGRCDRSDEQQGVTNDNQRDIVLDNAGVGNIRDANAGSGVFLRDATDESANIGSVLAGGVDSRAAEQGVGDRPCAIEQQFAHPTQKTEDRFRNKEKELPPWRLNWNGLNSNKDTRNAYVHEFVEHLRASLEKTDYYQKKPGGAGAGDARTWILRHELNYLEQAELYNRWWDYQDYVAKTAEARASRSQSRHTAFVQKLRARELSSDTNEKRTQLCVRIGLDSFLAMDDSHAKWLESLDPDYPELKTRIEEAEKKRNGTNSTDPNQPSSVQRRSQSAAPQHRSGRGRPGRNPNRPGRDDAGSRHST